MNDAPVIELRGVAFRWPESGNGLDITRFELERDGRALLLGPSGGGKSTLISLICGTIAPQQGSVRVDGTDITALRGAAADRFRAERIGVIFQMFNLLPFLSALENVMIPLRFAPDRRRRAGDMRTEAARLLGALGLPEALRDAPARRLSVGQQQRVAAARALIGRPRLILADEPTSALDRANATAFLDLLFAEAEAAGSALLMVSHDETLVGRFERVIRLDAIARMTGAAA